MTLATYIFGVPVLISMTLTVERWTGTDPWHVVTVCAAAVVAHCLIHYLRFLPSHPASDDAFLDELSEEIQTLGLST